MRTGENVEKPPGRPPPWAGPSPRGLSIELTVRRIRRTKPQRKVPKERSHGANSKNQTKLKKTQMQNSNAKLKLQNSNLPTLGLGRSAGAIVADLGLGLSVHCRCASVRLRRRGSAASGGPWRGFFQKRSIFGIRAWKTPLTLFLKKLHRRVVVLGVPSEAHLRGKTSAALILAPIAEFPGGAGNHRERSANANATVRLFRGRRNVLFVWTHGFFGFYGFLVLVCVVLCGLAASNGCQFACSASNAPRLKRTLRPRHWTAALP